MSRWENFSIWRGRLPHWRADGVRYYATFRSSRELDDGERTALFRQLLRCQQKGLDLELVCVLPERAELIFQSDGKRDLSDVLEKAKVKAGKEIIRKSGEKYSPFYSESYDHIIRDDGEYQEFWDRIIDSPVTAELAESPEEYAQLYVPFSPEEL